MPQSLDDFLDEELEKVQEEKEPSEQGGEQDVVKSEGRGATVYYKSSEDMCELDDESVYLIVTSPPYNADWAYGSHDDNMDYQTEYIPMLARVFKECWRVLKPSGRMIVNVPTLLRGGSSGGQSIISDIDTMINDKVSMWRPPEGETDIKECMETTEFTHREFVVWNKGFNNDGMAPNGSFPRPGGILLNNMHEGASVYQKPGSRSYDGMPDGVIENSKINKTDDDMCDDVWDISPENHDFDFADEEDVPPFPEKFAERCIQLWTYEGDTVLDPFNGRGTTGKMAIQNNRKYVGYELREELKKDVEEYIGINQSGLDNW